MVESVTKLYEDLDGRAFRIKFERTRDAVLLDVRTPGEFNSGSLYGAINIDVMSRTFRSEISKLDKNKEYFLFCRSGSRSGQACTLMAQEGFKSHNLAYGIGDWPR